jgi:methylphosphotriester-DNA--protein-cysteine methyltransferase
MNGAQSPATARTKTQRRVRLTAPEYKDLKRITRLRTVLDAEVVRAKILLLGYEHPDWRNTAIARAVGCADRTVRKWRRRSRAGPVVVNLRRSEAPDS